MASPAQLAANRANARCSTGPRTPQGKAASSRNSTTHGLSSKEFVIEPGEEDEFTTFMNALHDAIQPVGALEEDLFAQHAHASWGLRRCRRAEVISRADPLCKDRDPLLVHAMGDRLKRLDLYTRRAERTYKRTLSELRTLQSARLAAAAVDPLQPALHPLETQPPPPLLDPVRLNRQRAAAVRAKAASDAACDRAIFRSVLDGLRIQLAPSVASESNQQTQSRPATA